MNRRIQCEANPAKELTEHCKLVHRNNFPNVRREPNEDAYTCLQCDMTFVGGPTVEEKQP